MRTVFDQRRDNLRELYRYSRTNRKLIVICIALTGVQILQVVWMR